MLWVDKHRPSKLEDLSYHDSTTARLQALAANPATLPHLLVYGPPGSGKCVDISSNSQDFAADIVLLTNWYFTSLQIQFHVRWTFTGKLVSWRC